MPNAVATLFQPIQIGPFTLKSRIVMAPMTRSRASVGGVPSPLAVDYYRQRASAGLIITEGTQPSYEGQGYCRTPGLHTPAQVAAWRDITDAVHAEGGRIFAQLMHVGRVGHPDNQHGDPGLIAPSAIQAVGKMFTDTAGMQEMPEPREATATDLKRVIGDFEQAARLADEAGFDGVELHAANGYLPMQFLSTSTNKRVDDYGGDAEGRCRFVVELIDAMLGALGPGRVGIRISPGGTFNDISDDDPMLTYTTLLKALADRPLAFVHAQRTGWEGLSALKQHMTVPFILTGGLDAASGAAAIEAGEAELIGYGQAFIANPDLPRRLREGAPLADADPRSFFSPGPEGYTDYPSLPKAG